ncbi:hypothetical protein ES705_11370 [subsurface metagenome]
MTKANFDTPEWQEYFKGKSPLKIALKFFGTVFLFTLIFALIDLSEAREGAEKGF